MSEFIEPVGKSSPDEPPKPEINQNNKYTVSADALGIAISELRNNIDRGMYGVDTMDGVRRSLDDLDRKRKEFMQKAIEAKTDETDSGTEGDEHGAKYAEVQIQVEALTAVLSMLRSNISEEGHYSADEVDGTRSAIEEIQRIITNIEQGSIENYLSRGRHIDENPI